MSKCQRCGKETETIRCSRFNTQMCCDACLTEEEAHPDYARAREIEHEHVKAGDYNFPGVGLPEDLARKYPGA